MQIVLDQILTGAASVNHQKILLPRQYQQRVVPGTGVKIYPLITFRQKNVEVLRLDSFTSRCDGNQIRMSM